MSCRVETQRGLVGGERVQGRGTRHDDDKRNKEG